MQTKFTVETARKYMMSYEEETNTAPTGFYKPYFQACMDSGGTS